MHVRCNHVHVMTHGCTHQLNAVPTVVSVRQAHVQCARGACWVKEVPVRLRAASIHSIRMSTMLATCGRAGPGSVRGEKLSRFCHAGGATIHMALGGKGVHKCRGGCGTVFFAAARWHLQCGSAMRMGARLQAQRDSQGCRSFSSRRESGEGNHGAWKKQVLPPLWTRGKRQEGGGEDGGRVLKPLGWV